MFVKETSGLWRGSPEWEGGHRKSSPQESSRGLVLDDGCVAELVSCVDLQALHETVGLEPTAGKDAFILNEKAL